MNLFDIGVKKLSLFFKNIISDEQFEKFSEVLDKDITQEDIAFLESNYLPNNFIENFIWNNIKDNNIARTCMELAMFQYSYPYSNDILQLITNTQPNGITLKMASLVIGYDSILQSNELLQAYNIIKRILSIKQYHFSIEDISFNMDFTLAYLITNENYVPSTELKNYVDIYFNYLYEPLLILWKDNLEKFSINTFSSNNSIGIMYGEELSGRKCLIKDIIHSNKYNTIMVNYNYFQSDDNQSLNMKIIQLIRDCFLMQAVLCITDITYDENSILEQKKVINVIKFIMFEYSFIDLPLFITATPNVSIVPYLDYPCYTFNIPKLSFTQSKTVWNYFKNQYNFNEENCFNDISQRIILPIGKIQNVVYSSIVRNIHNDKHRLSKLCYNLLEDKKFKSVNKIYPQYTWEDLKLPQSEKDILQQICYYVQYKDFIMNDWDMAKSYQYGSCASALFTGPPGTGKTMSAHVIANTLNLALYRVDLSQIMDKYIGETEKHLNEIFDYAENSNAVLFFDEADALIGKRSDISDSKDKFANTQVSYILQRIEEFNGIVLIATNYSNNIDPAIIRRIRYVVKFQLPDSEIREEIWKSLFNNKIPYQDIDFKFLSSDEFEFSGAVIKNIVLNSAILAVSENSPVTMSHIARSIVLEYCKNDRTIIPPSIQQYLKL